MSTIRKSRLVAAIALVLPLAMLAALMLALSLSYGRAPHAQAAVEPGLDFSIAVGSQCDSTAGPTTCTFAGGEAFTVDFKANAIGSLSAGGYGGYDMDVTFSGDVTYNTGSLQQTGAGVWPGCVFATAEAAFTPGENYTACSIGPGAPNSTYTGVMLKMGFTCGATGTSGTITLVVGDGRTDLVDSSFISYTEASNESLSISCGGGPVTPPPTQPATSTPPPGATATNTVPPQPTATRPPATATPVRSPTATLRPATVGPAPTSTRLPALAPTGSGDQGNGSGTDQWLVIGSLLGLAAASGALFRWRLARSR